jgi:hypothetical protein
MTKISQTKKPELSTVSGSLDIWPQSHILLEKKEDILWVPTVYRRGKLLRWWVKNEAEGDPF